jgi:hypothetical protein
MSDGVMSDGVTISSGGAITVDADDLRRVADDLDGARTVLADAVADLDRTARFLAMAISDLQDPRLEAQRMGATLEGLLASCDRLTSGLRTSAAAYELIELRIQRDAAIARGGRTAVDYLDARIAALMTEYPDAADIVAGSLDAHRRAGDAALAQLALLGAIHPALTSTGLIAAALLAGVRSTGYGRIARNRPVPPRVPAPPMQQIPPSGPVSAAAPATLAAAVGRIPSGGEPRVRIERYEMPDGTQSFAVYVTGTQAFFDRAEPWNMISNGQLFPGKDAASVAAVREALEAAGAEPGDQLYAFGHSQGGMIVDALAAEGDYRVEVLGTVGSPTSYDADPGTFSVELRHTDDPVAALAAGGHPQQVGAPGSFVAERTADPAVGLQDLTLAAHQLDEYVDTAALVDESGDPRADQLHDRLAVLATATAVSVYEYAPVPSPDATPAPSPQPHPTPELATPPPRSVSPSSPGVAG